MVIAIIALLAALLLPALRNARLRAQEVVCVNNLGQLGKMIDSYTLDHDGYLSPGGRYQAQYRHGLASRLADYAMGDAFSTVQDLSSAQNFYRGPGKIFQCPSDTEGRADFHRSYLGTAFAMGHSLVETPRWGNTADFQEDPWLAPPRWRMTRRLEAVDPRGFLLVENWIFYLYDPGAHKIWGWGWDTKSWRGFHFLNFPAHGPRRNILHAGGHVGAYVDDPGSTTPGQGCMYYSVPPPP